MSFGELPCLHTAAHFGTITAGPESRPLMLAATCPACVEKVRGWLQWKTGHPAGDVLTYAEARSR